MSSMVDERSSNFELLRIIAMLVIVALHSVYFGVQFDKYAGGGYLLTDFFLHFWAPSAAESETIFLF